MIHALGEATILSSHGNTEITTYTCVHCNAVRYLRSNDPKMVCDPGGICRKCMQQICSNCVAKDCLHLEKRLALYERNQALFRAMGLEL